MRDKHLSESNFPKNPVNESDVPIHRLSAQNTPQTPSNESNVFIRRPSAQDVLKYRHRDSQKRIYGDYVYFITCNIDIRIEFFADPILCELWMEELKLCKENKKFQLIAFCLNYDHFHLIIKPNNKIANYSEIMRFFKRNFSCDVNKILGFIDLEYENFESNISECDNPVCDNPKCRKFIDWNHGDDLDRRLQTHKQHLRELRLKFNKIHGTNHKFPKFKWQKSFYDHIIRDQNDLENHWNYTMYNYLKHNLPEDWQYTGLNYPELIDDIN